MWPYRMVHEPFEKPLQVDDAVKWEQAMQDEYESLIANGM